MRRPVTDPVTRARLAELQARLAQPTPRALEGQQELPVGDDPGEDEQATQPTLW